MFTSFLKKIATSLALTSCLLIFATSQSYAAAPTFTLESSATTLYANQTFTVKASIANSTDPHRSTDLRISFDPSLLEVKSITQGTLYFSYSNSTYDNTAGTLALDGSYFGSSNANNGTIATITFKSKAAGVATLDGSKTVIRDQLNNPFTLSPATLKVTSLAAASGATLTLNSDFSSWALGDSQWVTITLDTQGNDVAGVDAVLKYDPTVFKYASHQISGSSSLPGGPAGGSSGLFTYQPNVAIDQTNGKISLSAVAAEGSPANATGEVFRVQFTTISSATSTVFLDWTLGSTTDTNIASYYNLNQDLLTAAPATFTITSGQGAQLSFSFGLLDFIGNIASKSGTIKVKELATSHAFSNPSAAGEISSLALGTLVLGNTYNLELHVPGYLAKKSTLQISSGSNPSSGFLNYGNLTPGDINDDAVINTFDLNQLFSSWGTSNNFSSSADLNGDTKVNTFDTAILYNYFNQSVTL